MRPKHIILLSPLLDLFPSVLKGQEPIDVKAFIPKRSVERLDHGIIHRFSRPGKVHDELKSAIILRNYSMARISKIDLKIL